MGNATKQALSLSDNRKGRRVNQPLVRRLVNPFRYATGYRDCTKPTGYSKAPCKVKQGQRDWLASLTLNSPSPDRMYYLHGDLSMFND